MNDSVGIHGDRTPPKTAPPAGSDAKAAEALEYIIEISTSLAQLARARDHTLLGYFLEMSVLHAASELTTLKNKAD